MALSLGAWNYAFYNTRNGGIFKRFWHLHDLPSQNQRTLNNKVTKAQSSFLAPRSRQRRWPLSKVQIVSFEAGSGLLFRTQSFIAVFPDARLEDDVTPASPAGKWISAFVRTGLTSASTKPSKISFSMVFGAFQAGNGILANPFASKRHPFAFPANRFTSKAYPFVLKANPFASKGHPFASKAYPFALKASRFTPKQSRFI